MSTTSDPPGLPAFLGQSRAEIHAKYVDLEWQQRNRLLQGTQQPLDPSDSPSRWARLTGDKIAPRNRYPNVEPFAQNRIKLRVGEGVNDYINASPIQLAHRRYIATQGPKVTSINHFYRMLNSETRGTAVVVMLTQTHESGKEKCFQYYPLSEEESPLDIPPDEESGDGFQGQLSLVDKEFDPASRSEVRRMKLHIERDNGTAEEKDIAHLLFSGWPDFLIPEGEDRTALLQLIELSAKLNNPPSTASAAATNGAPQAEHFAGTEQDNPRIVHCSAGVGRSGTFIALDFLLGQLHSGQFDNIPPDKDPVAETVDSLRQQRMMMVQGEGQFFFVYDVLKEQCLARLHNLGNTTAAAT